MNDDSIFSKILISLKRIIFLNIVFLLLMSLNRFIFFIYYSKPSQYYNLINYIFKAFILGIRFDLVVVAYINTIVTLSILIILVIKKPSLLTKWFLGLRYYYSITYSLVFTILLIDFGFYSYFKNHINILIFGVFEDDTKALFSTIWENYNIPLIFLGFLLVYFLIIKICTKIINIDVLDNTYNKTYYNLKHKILFVVLLILINILTARGSLGMFPLGIMDAGISPDIFINKLPLNGIHTLFDAISSKMKEKNGLKLREIIHYSDNIEYALKDFLGLEQKINESKDIFLSLIKTTPQNKLLEEKKPNVILLMLEGFGTDLIHYDSDRFQVLGELKKHFNTDYVFYNFISGDMGTVGSVETVFLNLPKIPKTSPISQSKIGFYTHISGAAWPFRNKGYLTSFVYGGDIGWRNMNTFAYNVGFEEVEGQGAMESKYKRNQWGVYDEYLYEHIYKKLSKAVNIGKPIFIFALTTSNHPPYSLPDSYMPLPLEIDENIERNITGDKKLAKLRFATYQYANQKLGEFISKIKNSKFGDNTIIAVTGDHNFWGVFDYSKERFLDLYGVPFYIYIPEKLKPKNIIDTTNFGSHIDIMPTLYNLSLSNASYLSIGKNILDSNEIHVAFNPDGFIAKKDIAVRYWIEANTISCFAFDKDNNRLLKDTDKTDIHNNLLIYFKSAIAITDFILKNPQDLSLIKEK